jgi:PKHD-type hydroxylase
MDYQILSLLDPSELDPIHRELAQQTFVDGKATAAGAAREGKLNLQTERTGPAASVADRIILGALHRNPLFQSFAIPNRLLLPIFSRYEPGMRYDAHVDHAIMGRETGEPLRTDLALTLFLNKPDSYDGGALIIQLASGEQEIKLGAGEAIVYSAKSIHRVEPVTRGVRLAAVTWIQSAVRDERMRAILHSLDMVMNDLAASGKPNLRLSQAYHNLLRLSAEY